MNERRVPFYAVAGATVTVVFEPPADEVLVGFKVEAPRPFLLSDLKVGRVCQTANVAHFWADVLDGVRLRTDRTHGALYVSAVLTDLTAVDAARRPASSDSISGEAVFVTTPYEETSGRPMVIPLGFWDDSHGTQEPIAPGETRKLVARTQVAGVVKRVAFSRGADRAIFSSIVGKRPSFSFSAESERELRQEPDLLYYSAFASDLRGLSTEVDLEAGDAVELAVKNTADAPVSARDFVALIER